MEENFYKKINELLKQISVEINMKQSEKFYKYMELMLEWNEKINLTAITDQDEIILKHFVDCLTILKYINVDETVVDMGTGAGFPGVPLAIMLEKNNFTLVDSLNKRINFLNIVKENIDLQNVTTIHNRAEDFGQNKLYREKNDVAVSRAVAPLNVLVEYLLPLVKTNGKIICMKGSKAEEEIEQAKYAIKELGGKIELIDEFYLPGTDMKRTIIIIKKIDSTPKKYPRKAGIPSKNPLIKS